MYNIEFLIDRKLVHAIMRHIISKKDNKKIFGKCRFFQIYSNIFFWIC